MHELLRHHYVIMNITPENKIYLVQRNKFSQTIENKAACTSATEAGRDRDCMSTTKSGQNLVGRCGKATSRSSVNSVQRRLVAKFTRASPPEPSYLLGLLRRIPPAPSNACVAGCGLLVGPLEVVRVYEPECVLIGARMRAAEL
ncbi:hypothetical protein CRG98_004374 [Punica granatum]|uniref:Uncharacterized protein n=1 Tax=Punica granatum TaxID=22663 RepID=A0A2I0L3L6_PUNGR|nr:hypothetical protein CRG98_004374 [Punica granatum]